MKVTAEKNEKVAKMIFASIYPLYLNRLVKNGRTKEELNQVIEWFTGFDKDDFKIELDNFNLSVSLDKDDKMNETIHYNKREYNYSSFKRSFKLAKYSDIKKIDASYVNGILTIQIPKTKEAIPLPVKSIKIS